MRTRQKARLEVEAAASDFLNLGVSEENATKDEVGTRPSASDHAAVSLSSCLDPGPQPDLYFSCDPDKMADSLLAPYPGVKGYHQHIGTREKEVMKDCVITPDFERKECAPPISLSKHERKKINQVWI